jgi:hypothetical protein
MTVLLILHIEPAGSYHCVAATPPPSSVVHVRRIAEEKAEPFQTKTCATRLRKTRQQPPQQAPQGMRRQPTPMVAFYRRIPKLSRTFTM